NKIYVIAELWSRLIGEVILMPHETECNYSVLSAWDSNLTVMRLFFCLHPSRCSRAAERMNNENP
ncbi:hypothetical protein, partial [Brotocaccenecus cirricatena]